MSDDPNVWHRALREFEGERAPVGIRPDQPDLPMAVHSAPDGFDMVNESPI